MFYICRVTHCSRETRHKGGLCWEHRHLDRQDGEHLPALTQDQKAEITRKRWRATNVQETAHKIGGAAADLERADLKLGLSADDPVAWDTALAICEATLAELAILYRDLGHRLAEAGVTIFPLDPTRIDIQEGN